MAGDAIFFVGLAGNGFIEAFWMSKLLEKVENEVGIEIFIREESKGEKYPSYR